MVFLSDQGHIVATEKIRNMRTFKARSTMPLSGPEPSLVLFYDARGEGIDRQVTAAPVNPRNFKSEIGNNRPDCSGTIAKFSA